MKPAPARAAGRVNRPSIRHSPMPNRHQVSRKASCSIRFQAKRIRTGREGPRPAVLGQGTEIDDDDRASRRSLAAFVLSATCLCGFDRASLLRQAFFRRRFLRSGFRRPSLSSQPAVLACAAAFFAAGHYGFHFGLPLLAAARSQQARAFKAFSRASRSAIQPLASLRRSCISSQRRCVMESRAGIALASRFVTLQRLEMGLDLVAVLFDELVPARERAARRPCRPRRSAARGAVFGRRCRPLGR